VARALPSGVVSADLRTFSVDQYLRRVVWAGKRWRDLRLPAPCPLFQRAVLLSTRLDTSNSAELYLALASFAVNGDAPVPSANPGTVTDQVEELFRAQGSTALTSEEPFDQYTVDQAARLARLLRLPARMGTQRNCSLVGRSDPYRLVAGSPQAGGGSRCPQPAAGWVGSNFYAWGLAARR
jgi:hypothetical protein